MEKSKNKRMVQLAFDKGYRVTEDGQVLSPRGKFRKLQDSNGYKRFNIGVGGTEHAYPVKVHVLTALQHFGDAIFKEGVEVRHLDNNPSNNSRKNLTLGTAAQNSLDRPSHMRGEQALKAARVRRRLTYEQAEEIRRRSANGETYATLCADFGIGKSTVSYIVNKKMYVVGP